MKVLFESYLDCLVTILFVIGCLLGELFDSELFGMVFCLA